MRKVSLLSCAIGLLLLAGCSKESTTLQLQFAPLYGGQSLQLNKLYTDPNGLYFKFSALRFFVSHVQLIRADGSRIEVQPLAYLYMDSPSNMTLTIPQIPPGNYTGVTLAIGMDSAQNDTAPNLITNTSDPRYQNTEMWWGSTLRYVHLKMEGYYGNTNPPLKTLRYHIGTPSYYRKATLLSAINTTGGGLVNKQIELDVQKLFYGQPYSLDVSIHPSTQTTDQPTIAAAMITAIISALAIR
jgi:hypothetical protein